MPPEFRYGFAVAPGQRQCPYVGGKPAAAGVVAAGAPKTLLSAKVRTRLKERQRCSVIACSYCDFRSCQRHDAL